MGLVAWAESSAGIPDASIPQAVVLRMTSNMAASIRGHLQPSLDLKFEASIKLGFEHQNGSLALIALARYPVAQQHE